MTSPVAYRASSPFGIVAIILPSQGASDMHIASSLLAVLLASIDCAASANRGSHYTPKQPPLTTPWTDEVGTNPWPEYPRPQLQRSEWKNLNGIWRYENATNLHSVQQPPFGKHLSQEVLVPSCLESALSGKSF